MAYGEKYFHTYCDDDGTPIRISILFEDYEGSTTEVDAAPVPISINYEGNEDVVTYGGLMPSRAEIILYEVDGFDLEELFASDEREIMVEKYVDSSLDWRGFVIPNDYSAEWDGDGRFIQFSASDGLNTLKDIPFLDTDGKPYGIRDIGLNDGFEFPINLVYSEILRKLDLNIDNWISIDVREKTMLATMSGEYYPETDTFVNVKTYFNDQTNSKIKYWKQAEAVWNCHDVLDNLLKIFRCVCQQRGGVWRIRRWNIDASRTGRNWHIFNSAGVFVSEEPMESEIVNGCLDDRNIRIGRNFIGQNKVLDAVRVNYEYAYARDSDEAPNLFKNPNFAEQGSFSPVNWNRWENGTGDDLPQIAYIAPTGEFTEGIQTGIEIQNRASPDREFQYGLNIEVVKGDNLYVEWFEKISGGTKNGSPYFPDSETGSAGIYTIFLDTDVREQSARGQSASYKRYFLANTDIGSKDVEIERSRSLTSTFTSKKGYQCEWFEDRYYFISLPTLIVGNYSTYTDQEFWVKTRLYIDEVPESGRLRFRAHGVAVKDLSSNRDKFVGFYPGGQETKYTERSSGKTLSLTGFFASVVKETSNDLVPSNHVYEDYNDYQFTDRIEPVTIYNGDANDLNHVSRLIVPTAGDDKLFWDNLDQNYGWSPLGLILVKSVLNQYMLPTRFIDCTLNVEDFHVDSVIQFDTLPGQLYNVIRGSFRDYRVSKGGVFSGTLQQVASNVNIDGGFENGVTVDPVWIQTGEFRCQKDGNGENTGFTEVQEIDNNVNSETYQTIRWIQSSSQDLTLCPLGAPSDYFWGADDASLDPNNLADFSVQVEGDDVSVLYSQDGGKYLYFLHRDNLGVVTNIATQSQPDITLDWQYLSDTNINGYTYRVLRMDFITGIADEEPFTFTFTI